MIVQKFDGRPQHLTPFLIRGIRPIHVKICGLTPTLIQNRNFSYFLHSWLLNITISIVKSFTIALNTLPFDNKMLIYLQDEDHHLLNIPMCTLSS